MAFLKKAIRDLTATLYDDQEYKVISLPRVVFAISVGCVIVAWITDQFLGFKYSNMSQLTQWSMANAAAYAAKKYCEK